jgi:hypothetical protein
VDHTIIDDSYVKKMLVDIAFSLHHRKQISVEFNGEKLPTLDIEQYYNMLVPDKKYAIFVHKQDNYQILFSVFNEQPVQVISFVNSLENERGTHVDLALKTINKILDDKQIK